MRVVVFVALALLASCALSAQSPDAAEGPSPFPVERGTAPPPPSSANSNRAAPPEGRAQGGVDFGQWRTADPAQYAPAFQTQMRTRYAARSAAEARADLEANGFVCEERGRLDCRIEIMERECAFDWYVVVESGQSAPIAGFDVMCLGAR